MSESNSTIKNSLFSSSLSENVGNTSTARMPRDGYDVAIYGLGTNRFLYLHITAIACISLGLTFSGFVLTVSFRTSAVRFFKRTKSERFVVYMALCDGFFNLAHCTDHLHIFITKNNPRPRELCVLYAFMVGEFVSAQMFMVNIVSINAFSMIYLGKDIRFGRYDWRLLIYTFGLPFIAYLVAAILGKLGPNGAFCLFDAINGVDMYVYFHTILTFVVIFVNSILYIITWIKIYRDSRALANILGEAAQTIKSIHNSARNMSLFVAVFLVQWFSAAAHSITALLGEVPEAVLYMAVVFTNIGGVLNGIVFILIRRRKRKRLQHSDICKSTSTLSSRV